MMTIFIKFDELKEFLDIVKQFKVRHGPFRKARTYKHGIGYHIDILEPGAAKTFFLLKYGDR
jgi:hypothetical protein